ncbi:MULTISPECIES: chloride channel protein [unclassified Motilimonas]|uniref:chloride channel protein n=1 Tax=Motilimonas TaxID=1914248 RepID=UPI001E4FD3DF|nr:MULTISPECIES: chloride channel protein [unclassified Motilimonas]MCE0557806.1 chloride channel protein [Motilimonas sp. E26]MDO6525666.1 chloride channel protein [Motilimonas sp. 1_MG-2023]
MQNASIGIKRTLLITIIGSMLCVGLILIFSHLSKIELISFILQYSWLYLAIPFIGAIFLALLFRYFNRYAKSGLPVVVMGYHFGDGKFQLGNAVFQYVAAIIALVSGFAVGAVGPALHVGAASMNLLGQYFHLNETRLRQLTACGAASAMAALFHTPITAIFFVQETIVRRFNWQTCFLVTICAFFSAWIARQLGAFEFHIDTQSFSYQLTLIPELIVVGAVCGTLATLMLKLIRLTADNVMLSYWGKFLLAASVTSLASLFGTEVLGLGNQLLEVLLYADIGSQLVLTWLIVRFLISTIAIGAAIPGGALGPSLLLGALTGHWLAYLLPNETPQVFVLVGMAAFFGAVLKSPISATLLVVETTTNFNLALPCLVGSVTAHLVQTRLLKQTNLIELLLARQNILLKNSPSLLAKNKNPP